LIDKASVNDTGQSDVVAEGAGPKITLEPPVGEPCDKTEPSTTHLFQVLEQLKALNKAVFPVKYNDKFYADVSASGTYTKLGTIF